MNIASVMTPDSGGRVLERMGVSDGTTLSIRKEEGGKIRVTSSLWGNAKVIGKDEVLDGPQCCWPAAYRPQGAPPQRMGPEDQPYDPYGLSDRVTRNGGDELIDD